ncbi:MAG TPA: CheR family methyltransferase [Gammaproteobacteria bacterium]|nr:CheR family methyltransferase [Gammaproteobacteria bacterium]
MSIGLRRALDVLSQRCEVDFACYEPATLYRRIRRRMERVADSDAAYAELLSSNPDEVDHLYRDVLIGVTEFFGDADSYDELGLRIRTLLKQSDGELRVWVAGCATGEELYSVAILLDEARSHLDWQGRIRLFASDVHQDVLKQASEGIYPNEALTQVSAVRRRRYFIEEGEHVRIVEALRGMAAFVNHNLLTDGPFSQLDLICCRNVLCYFEPAMQERVLERFRSALLPGGLLFLGPTEQPGSTESGFVAVRPGLSLYAKRRERRWSGESALRQAGARGGEPLAMVGRASLDVYEALLERYMPAAFVLDARERLLRCFGGAETLLATRPEAPAALPDLLEGRLKTAAAELLERFRHDGGEHSADVRTNGAHGAASDFRITVSALGDESRPSGRILVELRALRN